jgi:hypothetical protein
MWMAALPINSSANTDKIMMTLRSELDSLKRQLEAEVGSGADLLIQSTAVTPESVLQNMAPLLAKERRGGSNVDAMKLRRELDQLRADNMRLRLAGAGELEPDDEQVLLETFVTSLKEILIMRRARRFDADVFERYSTNLASLPDALVAEMYKNFLLIYLEQADRETLQRMTLELDEVRISRTSRVHLAMGADLLTPMASLMAYLSSSMPQVGAAAAAFGGRLGQLCLQQLKEPLRLGRRVWL